ncbi:deoxynucleoside kinase [Cetobacterium sp. 8H]|uniref:deoxynucleoside kinase n=1 Tax=Cetobacterium sp. 8H TaxID=2759681 RepID=UPI00163C3C75|nr:deoxynucleoside kinase [Cetobacterium sp. 8H]MBC2851942.1 deoxynucleoside kinase [Cetobacterium sp. 8H]
MKNVICIEGVVGAGKTTLGELLAKELDIEFFQEPYIDNPFLDKFYSNKERYSLLSQMYFLNKRIDIIEEAATYDGCIMDRSIYGDFLFAKMHLKNGYMTEEEFSLYKSFWEKLISARKNPKLIIYLEINVDNAIKKIVERGRGFELGVERGYWNSLNEEYCDFFDNYTETVVLKINIDNMDIRDNPEDRKIFFDIVKSKLKELDL